jgi:hypothetical protein
MNGIDFIALMEPVARKLLGEPNKALSKPGRELRWGTHGSLSVDLVKGTFYERENTSGGGVLALIKLKTGCASDGEAIAWLQREVLITVAKEHNRNRRSKGRIVAIYDYVDEAGKLLFQVCRYEPKKFLQRRPDGVGDWIWNIDGVRRILYRLPEVIEAIANDHTIFIIEGEKDVENLRAIGITATTNPGGVRKWRPAYNELFRGARVVIVGDNDKAGRDHVKAVALALKNVAASVCVLDLAACWLDCPPHGDVSIWLETGGGTAERLWAFVEQPPSPPPRRRPRRT